MCWVESNLYAKSIHNPLLPPPLQVQTGGRLLQSRYRSRREDHRRGATEEDPLSGVHSAWRKRSDGQERAGRVLVEKPDRQRSSLFSKSLTQLSSNACKGVQQFGDHVPTRVNRSKIRFVWPPLSIERSNGLSRRLLLAWQYRLSCNQKFENRKISPLSFFHSTTD